MWANFKQSATGLTKQRGFTIVELLIVIIVIAILAAIVIVAYTNVTTRANASAAQSAASDLAKLLSIANTNNGTYPNDLSTVNNGGPMPAGSTSYAYHPGSGNSSYCATITTGKSSYKITDTATVPVSGGCAGDGVGGVAAITNLITNPSMENGIAGFGNNNSSSTVVSSTTKAYTGTSSALVTSQDTNNVYNGLSFPFTATAGITYTYSAWVYLPAAYGSSGVAATANGPGIGVIQGNFITTTGSWARTSVTFTPTTTGVMYLYVITSNSATVPAGATFYADSMMLTQGTTTYNYADGSSPNWIWNGTANSSTSTGPPQ